MEASSVALSQNPPLQVRCNLICQIYNVTIKKLKLSFIESEMLSCSRRLQKEAAAFKVKVNDDTDDVIILQCNSDNIFSWTAVIRGPRDSAYQGYKFDLTIHVPPEYPLVPPILKFKTKIFHPNVHFGSGEICLDSELR